MSIENWALIFTAVAAAGAIGAALASAIAANQTRKASLGQILAQLVFSYGSTEMLNSLKSLREYKVEKGKEFAMTLAKVQSELNLNEFDKSANDARRMVFTFYENLRVLEKRKILTWEKDISEITGDYGVQILLEIIEPMEYEIAKIGDQEYSQKTFDKFRDWYPEVSKKYPKPHSQF